MSDNVVSALTWVRKGFAASNPKEFDLQEEDVMEMKQDPTIQDSIKQAQEAQKKADQARQQEEEEWDEQDYEDGDENDMPVFTQEYAMMKKGRGHMQDGMQFGFDEISNEDKEDYQITGNDAVLVAAKIEKEFSSLEVYVYEQEKSSLFVHHEITLSAFPLAIEWLPLNPVSFQDGNAKQGNFIIVGTFLPEIEIWDLDVLNAIEPTVILGGELDQQQQQQQQQKKSKKGKKVKQFHQQQLFKEGSHTDSVLSLNINSFRQNILVSGSADQTVKLWDIQQQKNMHTFNSHSGKVQLVAWNKHQEAVLMSGGYDRNVILQDVRQPQNALKTVMDADIEAGGWAPHDENILYVSTEDGYVSVLDARKFSSNKQQNKDQYICHFKAHNKQTTSVSFNPNVPGMLSTTSMDKTVKIFDMQNINNKAPKLVSIKNPNAGGLFCGNFYQDSSFVFACGNSNGEVFVWDTAEDKKIVETFGSRVAENVRPKLEDCTHGDKVITHDKVDSDDSDSEADMYKDDEQGMEQEEEEE